MSHIHYKTCVPAVGVAHVCNPCEHRELGGVRSVALIEIGTKLSVPFVKSEWEQGILAGKIVIIPKTTGTYDGGTPKTTDGFGDETETILGKDYVATFKDPDYAENAPFYANVSKHKWNIAFRSKSKMVYVDAPVSVTSKAPIEESKDSQVVWNIESKWFSEVEPAIADFDTIAEFFDCHEVLDGTGADVSEQ